MLRAQHLSPAPNNTRKDVMQTRWQCDRNAPCGWACAGNLGKTYLSHRHALLHKVRAVQVLRAQRVALIAPRSNLIEWEIASPLAALGLAMTVYSGNGNCCSSSQCPAPFCRVHSKRLIVKVVPLAAPKVESFMRVEPSSGRSTIFICGSQFWDL